jgi:hypothetical protein
MKSRQKDNLSEKKRKIHGKWLLPGAELTQRSDKKSDTKEPSVCGELETRRQIINYSTFHGED